MINPPRKRLIRSKEHHVLGGVLGGMAESYGSRVAIIIVNLLVVAGGG